MLALSGAPGSTVLDLRKVSPGDLDALLEEETAAWLRDLEWDFAPSAGLVRRFVSMHSLEGCALVSGGAVIGYAYYVAEDRKGVIGDLYVRERFRTLASENRLLEAVVSSLMRTTSVGRIESQLMNLRPALRRPAPHEQFLSSYARDFMMIPLAEVDGLAVGRAAERLAFEPWSARRQGEAAHLIAAAYGDHLDSLINDQYRTPEGAERFLSNIIEYPGCGSFFQPASFVALDPASGHVRGLSLASLVAHDVGHITQICVSPALRGQGAGYELLRRSLAALAGYGCRQASLTVTAANQPAVRLYERVGFTVRAQFPAYVWEGW